MRVIVFGVTEKADPGRSLSSPPSSPKTFKLMDQELTQQVGLQINTYYEQLVQLLLDSASYQEDCSTENVRLYLDFVHAALEQPYGRLLHLQSFILGSEQLMTDRMFPFCFLLESSKAQLRRWAQQARWLVEGLAQYEARAAESLRLEPHEWENDAVEVRDP